jgi:hypothetical protein
MFDAFMVLSDLGKTVNNPFGEHRGTGFAGPLVLPPVRGLA